MKVNMEFNYDLDLYEIYVDGIHKSSSFCFSEACLIFKAIVDDARKEL
jgi:hypothetical protein